MGEGGKEGKVAPDHIAIIVAIVAAFGGSGGFVAWSKTKSDAKLATQRTELDRFNASLAGFQALLEAERVGRKDLEKRMCSMERRFDDSEKYVTMLIQHINAGKPPPPPPRP